MTLYKNKYRIESTRLKNWDYSSNGYYYITICTKDRMHYLGDVVHGKMILSEIGKMAYKCWEEIPEHFPFVRLDEFVIMPNHLHGVIIIEKNVESPTKSYGKFGPQSKNIASIIRGFKIGVTKYAKNNNLPFKWQFRFYDHIIRDDDDLYRIRKYILNNPENWNEVETQNLASLLHHGRSLNEK